MVFNKIKNSLLSFLIVILMLPNIVFAYSNKLLVSGDTVGIQIKAKGIMVVGLYKTNEKNDISLGDYIIKINDEDINSVDDMIKKIDLHKKDGVVKVTYLRDGKLHETLLKLEKNNDGIYKTGLYVKDTITGVGTLTYIDPGTMMYGALGHAIIDKEMYIKYDACKNKSIPFNRMDIDEAKKFMSVDAERRVFEEYNKRIERCGQSYWIAKFFGDGYGYDILNYDYVNCRENLIEVKSSTENEYFDLTENEFIVMTYTENITNTDYYVYKFFYKGNIDNFTCKSYKYDKQRHMLVDTTDPSIVCEIEGEKINDAGNRIKFYRCTPKKLENIKTLINKM